MIQIRHLVDRLDQLERKITALHPFRDKPHQFLEDRAECAHEAYLIARQIEKLPNQEVPKAPVRRILPDLTQK